MQTSNNNAPANNANVSNSNNNNNNNTDIQNKDETTGANAGALSVRTDQRAVRKTIVIGKPRYQSEEKGFANAKGSASKVDASGSWIIIFKFRGLAQPETTLVNLSHTIASPISI